MLVQVGIIQFSTDVHIQQPLAHVDRTNLLSVMTDMVSRQLAISPVTLAPDAAGTRACQATMFDFTGANAWRHRHGSGNSDCQYAYADCLATRRTTDPTHFVGWFY